MSEKPEKTKLYTAKLIRGNLWMHKDIAFNRGIEVVIDDDLYDHLYAHAIDTVKSEDGETSVKSKFEYKDYDGKLSVGTALTKPEADPDAPVLRVRDRNKGHEVIPAPVARSRQRA